MVQLYDCHPSDGQWPDVAINKGTWGWFSYNALKQDLILEPSAHKHSCALILSQRTFLRMHWSTLCPLHGNHDYRQALSLWRFYGNGHRCVNGDAQSHSHLSHSVIWNRSAVFCDFVSETPFELQNWPLSSYNQGNCRWTSPPPPILSYH